MLSGATLGQFCPKDSVIHKLDPRVKIISTLFFIVLTFLSTSYLSLATLFATLILTMLLSKISIKTYFIHRCYESFLFKRRSYISIRLFKIDLIWHTQQRVCSASFYATGFVRVYIDLCHIPFRLNIRN